MSLSMMQMRADFASYVQTILVAHDAAFTSAQVDVTEREEIEQGMDRETAVSIYGNPAKYCAIRDMGQTSVLGESFDAAGNVACFIGNRMKVVILYEKDYDTNQTTFEQMIYNLRDAATPGLLDSMRGDRIQTVSSCDYLFGTYGSDAVENVIRSTWDLGDFGGEPLLCHYLEFETVLLNLTSS